MATTVPPRCTDRKAIRALHPALPDLSAGDGAGGMPTVRFAEAREIDLPADDPRSGAALRGGRFR